MHEHDREPIPGLPQQLPDGEKILWQGKGNGRSLVNGSFHVPKLAGYFFVLLLLRMAFQISDGADAAAVLSSLFWLSCLAAVALGIVTWFARRSADASMYTITDQRVVIRCGIAVPVTVNLPFKMITSLDLRTHRDGTGDVSIGLERSGRASYVLLFPMLKPFSFLHVRPVMRGVEQAESVCDILSTALKKFGLMDAQRELDLDADSVDEADQTRGEPEKLHLPLLATGSLVVIALVSVAIYQLNKEVQPVQLEPAAAAIEVFFEDREDGSVVVVDANEGSVIDTLDPETNGFMRGALRSLVRERRASGIGPEAPFAIRRTLSGGIQLADPATDRVIDLRAFGPTNAGAFSRLLDLADEPASEKTAHEHATPLGVTTVASTQEERDQ